MVSVSTSLSKALAEKDALRAEALQRHLRAVADELNQTVILLQQLGVDAEISSSFSGVAPGN